MFSAHRRNDKKGSSKSKEMDNIYHARKDERPQDDLKNVSVDDSALCGGQHYHQSNEIRGSGYWMVENSFYLSADNVVEDDNDGHHNVFEIDPAVYSEINNSGGKY